MLVKKLGNVGRDAGHEELTTNQVVAIPIYSKDVVISLPTCRGRIGK